MRVKRSANREQEPVELTGLTETLAGGDVYEAELNRNSGKVLGFEVSNLDVSAGEIIASLRGVRL